MVPGVWGQSAEISNGAPVPSHGQPIEDDVGVCVGVTVCVCVGVTVGVGSAVEDGVGVTV